MLADPGILPILHSEPGKASGIAVCWPNTSMTARSSIPRFLSACLLGLAASGFSFADTTQPFPENPAGWPEVSTQSKPWTRWWWLGSAVDKENLTRELEAFAKAGIGGVEICPIYGAVGAEDRFIDFLSPKWMEMLAHTTKEAKRLGLGVDMTTGTGWPFGGPMVGKDDASEGMQRIEAKAEGGKNLTLQWKDAELACLRAFPESGNPVDLKDKAKDHGIDWTPPDGTWTVSGIAVKRGIQNVKRAAPGGSGLVLDPYSKAAMNRYTAVFDKAFSEFDAPLPRARFHDSFEYYGADWSDGLLETFRQARGYDLQSQLPAFNGIGDPETIARVRADYRQTLGEMHHAYLSAWHDWAVEHGGITRNQAHGSPGNLLDHYAVSDIPETEIFRHVGEDQIPMLRFAASAANAKGRPLVSAETFTWLGEHFQVTPAQLKEAADFVFLGGVNHVFFHGIPYSPQDAPWPGWLFYASTHMGPNGGLWHDLPAFTGYLQRCQSILQSGKPDSEVLLYFPFADLIHDGAEKLPLFTIHNQNEWLHPTPFYQTAMEMWKKGITFDFVSDELLKQATVRDGAVVLGNNAFKVLVIPAAKKIPEETLREVARLQGSGGRIEFFCYDKPPVPDVPGFLNFEQRRGTAREMMRKNRFGYRLGKLKSILGYRHDVKSETMVRQGLRFVRRKHADGFHYFIVNRTGKEFSGSIKLATRFKSAVLLDPWRPDFHAVINSAEIPLRLAPSQSIVIRTFTSKSVDGPAWKVPAVSNETLTVTGPWKLEFLDGGPALPKPADLPHLASWTTLPDPLAKSFSGTARYSTSFETAEDLGSGLTLDLGKIAHTARVFLDGKLVGISWCPPHELDLSGPLAKGRHTLAIEVTNLAANRIAELDRRKVPWKLFHEINFVNIDYKPFDASAWPAMDSGLPGPVRLLIRKP